ncbi:retroviral-like aspartic protease family protein [Dechloromonas sp. XY25]|uniref:Retroviral-like aspartic protease family protein n=1 Tax=Dechloromonas hankyongensis TaxID=2908002 RepID=A0ABS9K2I9_9RHOO|nr:retropepsin-like aspartic protease [Dechloromonas hankyongensis]MCG2577399.1 retroviral-like aspartic protease family protein [Dechloromonas hankyongensis]
MSFFRFHGRLFAAAVCCTLSGMGLAWGECENRYFAATDHLNATPLSRPAKAFADLLSAAQAGNAQAQRSLAVSYESGYLVAACSKKAGYWYEKAAAAGDAAAQDWLGRHQKFSAMFAAAECSGASCFDGDSGDNRTAVLYANANKGEHYFAPLTINGHTIEGLIDTGASAVAMSLETARQMEIDVSGGKTGQSATANGNIATTSLIVPLVEVAGVKLRNVRVTVGITGTPLIGMSFLSRVDMTMGTGVLAMKKRQ